MKTELTALLVIDPLNKPEWRRGDDALRTRLQSLGYTVNVRNVGEVKDDFAREHSLVLISTLSGKLDLNAKFQSLAVPVLVADGQMLEAMRLCYRRAQAKAEGEQAGSEFIRICDSTHSLAAALNGKVRVTNGPRAFMHAHPGPESLTVATAYQPPPKTSAQEPNGGGAAAARVAALLTSDERRRTPPASLLFAYEAGAALCEERRRSPEGPDDLALPSGHLDLRAPARRVGIFIGGAVAEHLTADGWALFDAAVSWAVGEELKHSTEVFREEWTEIEERRRRQRITAGRRGAAGRGRGAVGPSCAAGLGGNGNGGGGNGGGGNGGRLHTPAPRLRQPPPENLTGLALSGGGIRSATFCLGLLQGMRATGVLRAFDYLSTVSGGGYIGGWWSAWLSRSAEDGDDAVYPRLNVRDIHGARDFAARLLADPDRRTRGLSEYLLRNFSDTAVDILRKAAEDERSNEDVKRALAGEFNFLLDACCRNRAALFRAMGAEPEPNGFIAKETRELYERRADLTALEMMRLNRAILEDAYPKHIGPSLFPPIEKIEPARSELYLKESVAPDGAGAALSGLDGTSEDRKEFVEEKAEVAKDLLCAGDDPSHHLRLFANYLTPRKGLLSGDTWRAIAVISRNLIMTWLILVPMLIATVLVGQLYFGLRPQSVRDFAGVEVVRPEPEPAGGEAAALPGGGHVVYKSQAEPAGRAGTLRERAFYAAWPVGMLLALAVFISSIWMFSNTSGPRLNGLLGAAVVWLIVGCAAGMYEPRLWSAALGFWRADVRAGFSPPIHLQVLIPLWLVAAFLLVVYAMRRPPAESGAARGWRQPATPQRLDLLRSQAVRVQTKLLVAFVVASFVLFFSGFGHEVVQWALDGWREGGTKTAWEGVQKWATAVVAAATFAVSVFTAVKASPMGGGEARAAGEPTLTSRLLFALAPPSMLLLLLLGAAYGAHWLSQHVLLGDDYAEDRITPLNVAMFAGLYLTMLFALAEVRWRNQKHNRLLLTLVSWPFVGLGLGLFLWLRGVDLRPFLSETVGPNRLGVPVFVPLGLALFFGVVALLRLAVNERKGEDSHRRRSYRLLFFTDRVVRNGRRVKDYKITSYGLLRLSLAAYAALLLVAWGLVEVLDRATSFNGSLSRALRAEVPESHYGLFCLVGVMLMLCLLCVLFETFRGSGNNRRSLLLLTSAYVVLLTLLGISFSPVEAGSFAHYDYPQTVRLVHVIVALFTVALSWVIALGWMADPNTLSMHAFYKERLVRAYLGASNTKRRRVLKGVSESDEDDDVCLAGLRNCQRGGPYHLVNTTLNLTAGRDLASAQRSSAMFVLSKHSCGSSRTGHRNTAGYMSGRLSLGTAVAASGAAAAPSMGSRTPSASLSMLMTLLNVRLGYWAPTPNKKHWRLRFAQLWPFYTMREFLSQTHDLSSYCYLTDGGHFDNTGLYSLVERGCRFIVVADCGADDKPCFSDIGEAIRRCRIDFGTEIVFDVDPFSKDNERKQPSRHFTVGRIDYHREHLRRLNWSEEEIADRKGRQGVIVVVKPSVVGQESPDVRQYKLENSQFPQQSTADQWFDESQFESYRKLGYITAFKVFDDFRDRFPAHGPFSLDDVEHAFNVLGRRFCAKTARDGQQKVSESLWDVVRWTERRRGVRLTFGFEHQMEEIINEAASRIGKLDDPAKPLKAARRNMHTLMHRTLGIASARRSSRLHEEFLFTARSMRPALFPFYDPESDGRQSGNGGPKPNGNGRH